MIHNFQLSNYCHVDGIENEFRRLGIKSYCYGFLKASEIIKYGKGNDKEWQAGYWGNRVVRQSDAFLGWEMGERYSGCNSKTTFRNQLLEKNLLLNKNLISLIVLDYTNEFKGLPDDVTDEKLFILEGKLVNAYIEKTGAPPKCNIAKVKGQVASNNFTSLYD